MAISTYRRMVGAVVIPVVALGLAACSSDEPVETEKIGSDDAAAQLSPEQAVRASYEGLDEGSYKMESLMTVNGLDFMDMTSVVDGESMQASQDLYMSAILEAMGEDLESDPEMAEMMSALFSDMHTETLVVDEVAYFQFSGGMFAAVAEEFGDDAWFTMDFAEDSELSDVYQQFGGRDLAAQTELILNELSDVEETSDGVYTGTLNADSESLTSLSGATDMGMGSGTEEMIDGTEVTVTLGDDGLLESIEMTLPETDGLTMALVSEVVETGGDYSIAAPEGDNLHDFSEFAGALQ